MEKTEIKLGDKVKDKVTGYTGIAVSRTQYLNGCVQYGVARKLKKNEAIDMTGDPNIDEQCLEVVQRKVIASKEYEEEDLKNEEMLDELEEDDTTGGPTRCAPKMR